MAFNRRGDIFDDFDREFSEMSRMMDKMMQGMRTWDWDNLPAGQPVYYGVSVNVGPDGQPHVQEFGNVRSAQKGLLPDGVREPFVTAFKDEPKGQLRVTALDGSLVIRAEGEDRKYEKELPLDVPVNPDSAKARYTNGVLEITLDVAKPAKAKGKPIKVE
jgi:HSP20 family protein